MYSMNVMKAKEKVLGVGSTHCREVLTRRMIPKIKKAENEGMDTLKLNAVMRVTVKLSDEVREDYLAAASIFTKGLLEDLAKLQNRKGKIPVKITRRKLSKPARDYVSRIVNGRYTGEYVTTTRYSLTINTPAWVLHNPYFISYYLGVLQVMAIYAMQKGVAKMTAKKTYREVLSLLAQDFSTHAHRYPGCGNVEKQLEAFFKSYETEGYFEKMINRKANGPYGGNQINGFLSWYGLEGAKLLQSG